MVRRALAIVLLAAAGPLPAAELGTLFHTPEERARLDRLRRGEPPESVAGPAREPRTPAVTGYVRRSDGRNTVWVDGTPVATRNDPRTFDPKAVLPRPAPKKEPPPQGGASTPAPGIAKPGDSKQAASPPDAPARQPQPALPPGKS